MIYTVTFINAYSDCSCYIKCNRMCKPHKVELSFVNRYKWSVFTDLLGNADLFPDPILYTVHVSPTHKVTDGLWALALLPPLCLQCSLQADAFLLQTQLAALQQAAFVLQLAHVGLQLLHLLAALRLGFTEPRRRLRLGPQQRVGFFQLVGTTLKRMSADQSVVSFPFHQHFSICSYFSETHTHTKASVP